MISIKGRKAEVLAALFNNARTQGLAIFDYKSDHVMTTEEATQLLKQDSYFDYLEGRVLKVDLSKDKFNPALYDRDNGIGAAQNAIDSIK